jgi:formylglycine-generating enzyme
LIEELMMRSIGLQATLLIALAAPVQADTFGSGANSFSIDFVTIGDPGNLADTTGSPNPAGSVAYAYRIGKYEISEQMVDMANALGGLGLVHNGRGAEKPATSINWLEAARFVNWLNVSTGNTPAYKFDGNGDFQLWTPADPGYDAGNLLRNRQAEYFLPSADEWYKAAYYDPAAGTYWDYPTGSNAPPTPVASGTAAGTVVALQGNPPGPANVMQAGGLSPYGAMAQGGNVWEWQETTFDLLNDSASSPRMIRGGGWDSILLDMHSVHRVVGDVPSAESGVIGFRVASVVPEPRGLAMIAASALSLLVVRRLRASVTA